MLKIRTGDLYLGNRWSLQSLLTKTAIEDCRWTEVGLFLVDETDPDEPETYIYLTEKHVEKVPLSELLEEISLQAVAHRSLKEGTPEQIAIIKSYLTNSEGFKGLSLESALEPALPDDGRIQRTTMGARVDQKGRPLAADPRTKSGYSPTDLVISALSAAGLISYDPDINLTDFNRESIIDDLYGSENPLIPSSYQPAAKIIEFAQQEAAEIIKIYLERLPQQGLKNIASSSSYSHKVQSVHRDKKSVQIALKEPSYVEQFPVPVLPSVNKGLANQIAEEEMSKSMDRRLRKTADQMTHFAKPKPCFRK